MTNVAILISYRCGNPEMLEICLDAVKRHTRADYEIIVIVDGEAPDFNVGKCDSFILYNAPEGLWGSQRHGDMLNVAVSRLSLQNSHRHVLTLDSDCLPIADGWLTDLVNQFSDVAGILHPWEPPPQELDRRSIEWRIRSGWNWNNTHVACQLTSLHYINVNGLDYRNCDDTGLCIPMNAYAKHQRVTGWMPTRCPYPDDDFDPEFNRDVCVVFGDKVCHVGGASRDNESVVWPASHFRNARQRILDEGNARWILEEGYCYKFNQEDAVIKAKMEVMYRMMQEYLKHNENLFR